MSWQRIVLPFTTEINPDIVEIGKRAQEVLSPEEINPKALRCFTRRKALDEGDHEDRFIVYFSPVAATVCSEAVSDYTLEPCEVPHHNEPNIAFVFGDAESHGRPSSLTVAPRLAAALRVQFVTFFPINRICMWTVCST